MASSNQNDLTERHLAHHQQSYISDPKPHTTTWVEQVVQEERIREFHSQSGMLHVSEQENRSQTGHPLHQQNVATNAQTSGPQQLDDNLKLFRPTQKEHIDDPIQRFLTPGSSEPSLFARPALNALNMSIGSMEGIEERERVARANADDVRANRKERKGKGIQQRSDGDVSSKKERLTSNSDRGFDKA